MRFGEVRVARVPSIRPRLVAAHRICLGGIQPPSSVYRRGQPAASASATATDFMALPRRIDTFDVRHRRQPFVPRLDSHEGGGRSPRAMTRLSEATTTRLRPQKRSPAPRSQPVHPCSPPRSAHAPSVAFGPGLRMPAAGPAQQAHYSFQAIVSAPRSRRPIRELRCRARPRRQARARRPRLRGRGRCGSDS